VQNVITLASVFVLVIIPISVAQAASDDTPAIAPQTSRQSAVGSPRDVHPNGSDGAAARPLPTAHLKVRVYNAGVVPAADQAVALRAAATTLDAAGIGTGWLSCTHAPSATVSMMCDAPLEPSELSVRLVNLPGTPSRHGDLRLGYSLVDTTAGAGKLATIYVDRVGWLAGQAGTDMPTLLGFAVAHEIGHLLLGSNAHSHDGLMRAVWSREELQRSAAADWLFGRSEAARMHTSILRLEGLRSSQRDFHANGCSAPVDDAAGGAAGASGCAGSAIASIRGVAANVDR
jgi:hypothetical protein